MIPNSFMMAVLEKDLRGSKVLDRCICINFRNKGWKQLDHEVFDDPKGISIGSMDFDNQMSTMVLFSKQRNGPFFG